MSKQPLIGRRSLRPSWPVNTEKVFKRRRYLGTKRSVLRLSGSYNPKTLRRELVLTDKKPTFWLISLLLILVLPIAVSNERFSQLNLRQKRLLANIFNVPHDYDIFVISK